MSVKISAAVWEKTQHRGGALLVLLALADFADDLGRSWPSVATLARRTRLGNRQVQKILQELFASGEVVLEALGGGQGRTNHYRVSTNRELEISELRDTVNPSSANSRKETLNSSSREGELEGTRSVKIHHDPLERCQPNGCPSRTQSNSAKQKRKHTLPDDFTLTSERRAVAESHGLDAAAFFAHFLDQCHAMGYTAIDWDRKWSVWCRQEGCKPRRPFKKRAEARPLPSLTELKAQGRQGREREHP